MNPRQSTELFTEVAVVALSIVVAYGLDRLFIDGSYFSDILTLVIASHVLAIVVRRAGFGMGVSALVSAAGVLIVGNVVLFPETAGSIVPTRETFDLVRTDLDVAWDAFSVQQAPVDPLRGFVATAGLAMWWVAALADWAAFRLRSTLEAIAPATTIFVFTVLLGEGSRPVLHAALYAGAVGAVLLSIRLARQARDEVWVASGAVAGLSSTTRAGVVAASVALVIGAVVGPSVPDAGEQLLDPSEWDDGPETRRVTSPLVEVSASLVNQTQREMFSVRVDNPSERHYWRQMALTDFSGREWRRSSNFDDADGRVGSNIAPTVNRRTVRQEITTRALGGIYLPAAYEVSNVISSDGVELEYEVETGALVVKRESEQRARAGFTYVIESQVPVYNPTGLPADATAGLDPEFVAEHTQLPPVCESGQTTADGCWNPLITAEAERITAGLATDYDRVLALQNYFINPQNFSYNINVALDHDVSSMEDFLFFINQGYCEQFSSTFAAMARSLGIPARVAVGFTWGEWNDARQEYVVRGEHAHAWPEVYFADVGWVVLDPTPGRAPAFNSDFARLAPAQLGENDAGNRGLEPDSTPTTLPAPRPDAGGSTPEAGPNLPDEIDPTTGDTETIAGEGGGADLGAVTRLLAAVLGVAAIVGAVPALRFLARRRRERKVAADPLGRSELAWDDATDALRLVGLIPAPSETPREFARRAMDHPRALGPVDDLASAVTVLRYADPADPIPVARDAQQAATAVAERCRAQVGTGKRWSEALDPRTIKFN